MEAILDIAKNGDYAVWISKEEIIRLYNHETIQGSLIKKINGAKESHTIDLRFMSHEEIKKLKVGLRSKNLSFCEGPHVMIEHRKDNHHVVTYTEEEMSDLRTNLQDDLWDYHENRYDSFTGNKIVLYLQKKQG